MKSINYSFSDLVDTCRIKNLLISFYELRGIPLGLIDLDGNILTCDDGSRVAVGWQDICSNFHRKHPESLEKCIKSNTGLAKMLKAGEKYSCYTCHNGLTDMAVPVYIEDEHMANLITGQFFFESPDISFFKKQAHSYGFDENEYMQALSKVPVFSAEFVESSMRFLIELSSVIGEMGLEKKKLLDNKFALQEIEEKYNIISQNTGDVIWLLDLNSFQFTYVSPSSSSLCGYAPEEILKLPPKELITPQYCKLIEKALPRRIAAFLSGDETARVMTCQVDQIHKNGMIIPTEMATTLLINKEGQVDKILGISRDITERKRTENMLQFQANILNNVRDCVIVHDIGGKIIYWNKGAEAIYGYLEEEIIGRNIKTLYLNRDKDQFTLDLEEILKSGEYNGEWEGKRKDSAKVHVDIRETVMHNASGEIIGIIGVSKDITERKKAEKALNDSEKHLRMITDNMVDLVSQTDVNGFIEYVSPSGKILLGYEPEELIGTLIFDYVHPGDLEEVKKAFAMAFVKVEPGRMEIRFKHANGHYIWLEIIGDLLFDENHLIRGAVFGARDVGERKKAEKQIKRSEAYYRTIFENTGTATIIVEEDTTISLVNAEFEKLYGYPKEEIEGKKSWKEFAFHDHKDRMEEYHNLRRIDPNLAPRNYEFKFIDRYGNVKDILTTVAIIPGTRKSLISLLDITDKKIAENRIKESLKEKEVLLKEIHHRVKNNLQIISSLLNLQTRCVDGEESINVLKESQNRVKTMAMVHEKLYQSEDLKNINFKEYIENLVLDLFYSYGIEIGTIGPQICVENLRIGIDTAIPCGLIINELVTNSLKYAFPNLKGMIKVELIRLQDKLELTVSDNGVGLPEEVEMENIETLGLKMVKILVDQLKGTLELDRKGGTRFKIIFEEL